MVTRHMEVVLHTDTLDFLVHTRYLLFSIQFAFLIAVLCPVSASTCKYTCILMIISKYTYIQHWNKITPGPVTAAVM